MFGVSGRTLLLGLGLSACTTPDGLLSRLTDAWGVQTSEEASPSITAAVVMGGLAADLCVHQGDARWQDVAVGDAPPLEDVLLRALGEPIVESVEIYESGALQVEISGVQVMDRDSASMRLFTAPGSASFGFEASVMDGKIGDPQTESNDPFGRLAFDVQADCAVGRNRVEGTAQWTNLELRSQKVTLPADSALSAGVGFDPDVLYMPESGTVSWSGRLDGMERTVTTYDAADMVVDADGDLSVASWPSYARGTDWVSEIDIQIAP